MAEIMVEVDNLTKVFSEDGNRVEVLKGVTFTIERGELVALLGVSGAGKTTLLQILGGLDVPTGGTVRVGGKRLDGLRPRELASYRNSEIGFVFQFHHLLPDFTALENALLPGLIGGRTRQECEKRASELLGRVGLSERIRHYPSELSGGERQRVALARALFNEPALVLADEPTGNLDTANGQMLLELFRKLNREHGHTFLIATHNDRLSQGVHRAIVLEDGRVAGVREQVAER